MENPPVFIIDDDNEELDIIQDIWKELNFDHPLEVFDDVDRLFTRLNEKVNPFVIISDVNLPKVDGFSLREKLANDFSMSYKSIPFIFWSTSASNDQIKRAYDSGGHGFFMKGNTYREISKSLQIIMTYWKTSRVPALPHAIS
jgi:CheY-like chemotaxis protein